MHMRFRFPLAPKSMIHELLLAQFSENFFRISKAITAKRMKTDRKVTAL